MDDGFNKRFGFLQNGDAKGKVRWIDFYLRYLEESDPDYINIIENATDPTMLEGSERQRVVNKKTIWKKTDDSFNSIYVYFDCDEMAKHKILAGVEYAYTTNSGRIKGNSNSSFRIYAGGADTSGKTGGVWISGGKYWTRTSENPGRATVYDEDGFASNSVYPDTSSNGILPAFSL